LKQEASFRYLDPGAAQVALTAEFADWRQVPMKRDNTGVWIFRVRLKPGEYLYNFVVDRRGILDPMNHRIRRYGDNESSVIIVKPGHSSIVG